MVEYGFNDTLLLGKECNTHPREYTIEQLQIMANKVGLITTRVNYEQLCNGLRAYFLKNGITTEEELQSHLHQGPTIISETPSRVLGANIDLDILFNSNPDEFLHSVEYFQNLEKYSSVIQRIGEKSYNGYVRKLEYNISGETYSVVLKGSLNFKSDSLVYEYLVGQCINVYAKYYPCFVKTYSVGSFITPHDYFIFSEIPAEYILPNPFHTYINTLDLTNIENMVVHGCKNNKYLVVLSQYLPIRYNLNDFLKKSSNKIKTIDIHNHKFSHSYFIKNESIYKLYALTTILHMVYQLLSSFANIFTHYDLHLENVVLIKAPKGKFINVIFHYPDGHVLQYNMCYMPVIIDYGRSFINCKELDASTVSSDEIMKSVCRNDIRSKSSASCMETCGNESGYKFSTDYDEKTDTFKPSSSDTYFIDYTRHNISHDCRLLHELLHYFDFKNLTKNSFIVKNLVTDFFDRLYRMDDRFGTHERTTKTAPKGQGEPSLLQKIFKRTPTIDNVIMAADKLTDIISDPKFNINNDQILSTKTLYGTLHIWTDLSRPFQFS